MSILDNIDKPDPPNASKAKRLPPIGSMAARNEIIEECARLVETCDGELHAYRQHLAAAIRALKERE